VSLWWTLLGPVLVVVVSFVLLALGFWQDSDVVAGFGAAGVVIGLTLPLLTRVELGGGTVGPSFASDFRQIAFEAYRTAVEAGAPPRKAAEIVGDVEDCVRAEHPGRYIGPTEWGSPDSVRQRVWDAVTLDREVGAIMQRLSHELGWTIELDVESPFGSVDFVVSTGTDPIAVQAAGVDEYRSADRLRRAAGRLGIVRGALVVPDGSAGAARLHSAPRTDLLPAVIEVQELAAWLKRAAGVRQAAAVEHAHLDGAT
jgi:hypothetical protein